MTGRSYTVVGVYREPLGQRFAATVFDCASPQEAELKARDEAESDLIVAAVTEGGAVLFDTYTDGLTNVPGQEVVA